jgi:hypothetical protein
MSTKDTLENIIEDNYGSPNKSISIPCSWKGIHNFEKNVSSAQLFIIS